MTTIVAANAAAVELYGVSADTIIGRHATSVFRGADLVHAAVALGALAAGAVDSYGVQFRSANTVGVNVWVCVRRFDVEQEQVAVAMTVPGDQLRPVDAVEKEFALCERHQLGLDVADARYRPRGRVGSTARRGQRLRRSRPAACPPARDRRRLFAASGRPGSPPHCSSAAAPYEATSPRCTKRSVSTRRPNFSGCSVRRRLPSAGVPARPGRNVADLRRCPLRPSRSARHVVDVMRG